jgi:hypothetical protein
MGSASAMTAGSAARAAVRMLQALDTIRGAKP